MKNKKGLAEYCEALVIKIATAYAKAPSLSFMFEPEVPDILKMGNLEEADSQKDT